MRLYQTGHAHLPEFYTQRMSWRFLSFYLLQTLAAVAAWFASPPPLALSHGLAAALLAASFWLVIDTFRMGRLLAWLKSGDTAVQPLGAGLLGEVFDRTRRLVRMRDRAIAESDRRLHDFLAALQASPNGVVLMDEEGRIEWFNQTAATHFGFDPQRDMFQHFGNLVREPAFAAYYAAGNFTHAVTMPGRYSTATKPVMLSVHMHPYGQGRSLLLSRDITSVEQAEAMRRDFVANVSHEIRTPLTVLSGFVETLQTLPLEEEARTRYLNLMAQQAQRMQTLVSDLLTLSRLEGSPLPPLQEWVPVDTLMAQCAQDAHDLSSVLWGTARELYFDHPPQLAIAGTLTELHSAMFNLIGNAVRYSAPDKPIRVSWQLLADGRAVFAVKDEGQGVAPEHLPRLTERFYRVDRSRSRETGGTGLGLAIVKHVAQRHGAELGIESTLGVGSKFSITFPQLRTRMGGADQ
jgi:two-component system, OmpR family, phosphate regulon sensor histidine kinase PhoR